jgi:hypothetical protein
MRDDELFKLVTEPQRRPPELRAYLVDRRNTRHRTEALQRLARYHDDSAQTVERLRGNPQLIAGLASLIRALGQNPRPVITLTVKQTQDAPAAELNTLFASEGMKSLRKDLVKAISDKLTPLYGQDMTDYGEVEEGDAMIEIHAKASKLGARPGYRIDWTMTMQASPDAAKFEWKTQTEPRADAGNNYKMLMDQYNDFKLRFDSALKTR